MYDLIIFDCDGTLVDSEYLNNKVTSDLLIEFGLSEYTTEKCIEEFAGRSWTEIKKFLDEKHGTAIPRDIIERYIQRVQDEMEDVLKPIPKALDVVKDLPHRKCVASNGERNNVLKSLRAQGFMDHFTEDSVFTKIQVSRAKPHPDLFLFAAEKMEVANDRCLVLEDSPTGVQAGVAANMDVWGFVGVSHDPEAQRVKLLEAGAKQVFDDFIHIRDALGI